MNNINNFNVKSELIKKHWKHVNELYVSYKELLETYDEDEELPYDELYDIGFEHWKEQYFGFVLEPIRDKVLDFFYKAQITDFKSAGTVKRKEKTYLIFYYLYQYFSLGIKAYHEDEEFEEIRLDVSMDLNMDLYRVFEEVWEEFGLGTKLDAELFEEKEEFYAIEVEMLKPFLSECWNAAKLKSSKKVKGILLEATGGDIGHSLDNNQKLEEVY